VFTSTTLAASEEVRSQPEAVSRAASSSESTSLRAQPSVTRRTVRGGCGPVPAGRGDPEREGTPRAYATAVPGQPDEEPDAELGGLKLRCRMCSTLVFCLWPFTVRTTPGGLPRTICTACFSVHVIEVPAETTPM